MNYFEMMCDQTGFRAQTTFWNDFSIADNFGEEAIKDTYRRAFNEWKDDYKYLTELVMVLNWKSWQFYEKNNEELTCLYGALFYKAQEYALNNLKDDELKYFLTVTD